jgi:CRP/FNR family nitrogen fixation transcriptional regulator
MQAGHGACSNGAAERDTFEALNPIGFVTKWRRDQEICNQESSPDHWYRMVSGAARKYVVRANGQRHIVDLLLPEDFFGFTSPDGLECAVQAISDDTTTICYPRKQIEALADRDPVVTAPGAARRRRPHEGGR